MKMGDLQSHIELTDLDGEVCVRKYASAAGRDDLREQIDLLQHLPPHLARHYPALRDFHMGTTQGQSAV